MTIQERCSYCTRLLGLVRKSMGETWSLLCGWSGAGSACSAIKQEAAGSALTLCNAVLFLLPPRAQLLCDWNPGFHIQNMCCCSSKYRRAQSQCGKLIFKSFLKLHCSEMFLISGYEARLLSVAACHRVASHCCHRCLGGQSTKLAILRTHSEPIKPKIHLLRKLN